MQRGFEVTGYDTRAAQLEALRSPQMKLELLLKDLQLMLEEGQRLSVPLPLTGTAQQRYADAAEAGAGAQDLAVVIRQFERLAGLTPAPR
jgi:3-hydroxyisobutyrate dehydrogenase-like beta-hydroxyacid dehydrogenase